MIITQKDLDAFKTLLGIIEDAYNKVVTSKEAGILQDASLEEDIGTWAIETKETIMYAKMKIKKYSNNSK